MAKTAVINVRTEPAIKEKAEALYKSMGVSLSDAINMFLYKSIDFRGLPFDLVREIPNAETLAAMKEADDIASGRIEAKAYASFQDALADVLAEDEGENCGVKLSPRFDLDDIRKIRDYDAEKYKNMKPDEIVAATKAEAASVLSMLDKNKITFV